MKLSLKRRNQRWETFSITFGYLSYFVLTKFAPLEVCLLGVRVFPAGRKEKFWNDQKQDFEVNWPQLTRHSPHS